MQRATQESVSPRRVLRYVGKDPSAVDPYWDFEHLPGDIFDADALRLWRLRVFVSKPARARLSMRRTEIGHDGTEEDQGQRTLPASNHILRYNGGPERETSSYEKLTGSLAEVGSPSTIFVVNLSKLDPGAFVVSASVLGAQQQDREMRFRIVRRAYSTYPGLAPGKAPVVRSHTGLMQTVVGGRAVQAIGYRWVVERRDWMAGAYSEGTRRTIVAEAVIGSGDPRWRSEQDNGEAAATQDWQSWTDYNTPAGIGLETPKLLGFSR